MFKRLMTFPYIIWMSIFTLAPIGIMLFYGFTEKTYDGSISFTLKNITQITNPVNSKALILSIGLALISTLICLILAYPLAYILAKKNVSKTGFILFLLILPMWMNFLLRTYAWLTILENNGVLNSILSWLNLPTINLINNSGAIVLGMVYNFLPFMILPIYNVLIKIDKSILEASEDLGANKYTRFVKVIFPLSLPGVISGITMVFVPALTTFVIPELLGGSKIYLIGNVIEQEFTFAHNWHSGSGLSIVLMLFVLVSMALFSKYDKGNGEGSMW